MNRVCECQTLLEGFAPGCGKHPMRDNQAGALLEVLRKAIYQITMATNLDDVGIIEDETLEGLCVGTDWMESVFFELEN